jgi:hypothetical protein
MSRICLVLLPALLTAAPLGNVTGVVLDLGTRTPLAGASVTIANTELGAACGPDGRFLITDVPVGTWAVEASMIGYREQVRNPVVVNPGHSAELEFRLEPTPIAQAAVTVRAERFPKVKDAPVSERNFAAEEIRIVPGGLGDIQRVVQALPSVVSAGDQDNEVVVRGGNPNENLFLIDDIEIPYPNHFGSFFAQGGPVSMLNPLLIREVDFVAGAFPARYGNRTSSVMDIRLKRGSTRGPDGNIDLGMNGVGGVVSFPLPGRDNSFIGSYHKSLLELMARSGVWGMSAVPYYDNALGKATLSLHPAHQLSLLGLWGKDYIRIEPGEDLVEDTYTAIQTTERYAAGLGWQALFGELGFGRLLLSTTSTDWDLFVHESTNVRDTLTLNRSRESRYSARYDASLRFLPGQETRIGVGINQTPADFTFLVRPETLYRYTYNPDSSIRDSSVMLDSLGRPVVARFESRGAGNSVNPEAYVQHRAGLGDIGHLAVGLRFDRLGYTGHTALAPRVGFSTRPLVGDVRFNAGWGWHYQPPPWYILLQDSVANRSLADRRSDHYIVGVERQFGDDIRLSLEGYYKDNLRLPIPYSQTTPDTYDFSSRYVAEGRGGARGLELFLQKKHSRNWHGSLAYSLAENWRLDPKDTARRFPADYDHRHILTVTGTYKLEFHKFGWYRSLPTWFRASIGGFIFSDESDFGVRFRYMSGRPYVIPEWNPEIRRWVGSTNPGNTERYPDYHRLDIRRDHKFLFRGWSLAWYFEIQNVYGRRNVSMYRYTDRIPERQTVYGVGFWPMAGLVIEF